MSTYAEERSVTEQRPSMIDEVIGNRHFDLSRRWLPVRLSGADRVACLTPAEKIKLSARRAGRLRPPVRAAWRSSSRPR